MLQSAFFSKNECVKTIYYIEYYNKYYQRFRINLVYSNKFYFEIYL